MTEPAAVGTTGPGCPDCGTPAHAGARFCEECGAPLGDATVATTAPAGTPTGGPADPAASAPDPSAPDPSAPDPSAPDPSAPTIPRPAAGRGPAGAAAAPAPGCRECGGAVDADGYCTQCGTKAPLPRDHMVEQPQPWVAAVSDRGIRHHRNEDAAALAADAAPGTWAALVVCDGVSSSQASDVASLAAARAARDVLVRGRGAGLASGSALTALDEKRLHEAGAAAAHAVAESTRDDHGDSPPSCTFVAATLDGARAGSPDGVRVAVGNVGDSRAYWVPDAGAALVLTTDDSWAAEQVADGVPRAEAEAGAQAHAITRWIGVDSHDQVPTVTHHTLTGPGWLLLCSDGLWNYCSEAPATAAEVARAVAATGGEPLATAQHLVQWANEQGGKDNITVALARIGAQTHEGDPA